MKIVDLLMSCAPKEVEMNSTFKEIYEQGTGKKFSFEDNKEWDKNTKPMVDAYFHAKYFLDMAVKYAENLKEAPNCLPYGWAGLLCFYNLR